jgi:hypothetical protein
MSVLTSYLINQILSQQFRTASWTKPSALYIGLISGITNIKAGTVTELSGDGYARVSCAPLDARWSAVDADGAVNNLAAFNFPVATKQWARAPYFGFWDASTSGHLLLCKTLGTPRTVNAGQILTFEISALTVQLDD